MIFYIVFCMHHKESIEKNSFWQSETWENILISSKQVEKVEWVECGNNCLLIEYRRIGIGMIGAFSLGIRNHQANQDMILKARWKAREYWAIFWQWEYDIGQHGLWKYSEKMYRHFLEPFTRIIDLTQTRDDILRRMHEKWRYNIRLAEKRWVKFQWADIDKTAIDIWMDILAETTLRDGFAHNSRWYYEAFLYQWKTVKLGFCTYENRVIAAGIFVYRNDTAIYYYGASTSDPEYRKHMAPYLLQWNAIEEGKRRGCKQFDFLGIASPYETGNYLAWVSAFKEKFGWEVFELGPKYLIPLSWKFWIFSLVRTIGKYSRSAWR